MLLQSCRELCDLFQFVKQLSVYPLLRGLFATFNLSCSLLPRFLDTLFFYLMVSKYHVLSDLRYIYYFIIFSNYSSVLCFAKSEKIRPLILLQARTRIISEHYFEKF